MRTHSAWHTDAVLPHREESISSFEPPRWPPSQRAAGANSPQGTCGALRPFARGGSTRALGRQSLEMR